MNENFKTYAKIVGKSVFKGLLVAIPGVFVSIVFGLIALYQGFSLFEDNVGTGGGHGGFGHVILFFTLFAIKNLAGFILLVSCAPAITYYFVLANKTSIQTAIYEIWTKKAQNFIMPNVQKFSKNIVDKTDRFDWLADKGVLKIKLLNQSRKDPNTNGLKKRVLNYIFKKTKLDNIDYEADEAFNKQELPNKISIKVAEFIAESVRPSWFWFRIVFFLQIILFIISLFY